MPITEALKKLIKTITGKDSAGETIEELVQNLEENYPEGNSSGGADIVIRSYNSADWEADPFSISGIREKLSREERVNVQAVDILNADSINYGQTWYVPLDLDAADDTEVYVTLAYPEHGLSDFSTIVLSVSEDGTVRDVNDPEPN